jgi:hypothetical protein
MMQYQNYLLGEIAPGRNLAAGTTNATVSPPRMERPGKQVRRELAARTQGTTSEFSMTSEIKFDRGSWPVRE